MKLIKSIIKPFKLEDAKDALFGDWSGRNDSLGGKGLWTAKGTY